MSTATKRGLPACAEPLDAALLLYVLNHHALYGYAPDAESMMAVTGTTYRITYDRLNALIKADFLTRTPRVNKSLRPTCTEVPIIHTKDGA